MRLIPLLLLSAALPVGAAEIDDSKTGKKPNDKTPTMVSVDDDPQAAMKKMAVAPGLKLDLFASEPSLQNAVSFAFDEKSRCYVVETHRRRTSVFDIRNYRDWTDADLSFRSVEDRIKFLKEHVSQDDTYYMNSRAGSKQGRMEDFNGDGRIDWKDLEVESERIQVLMDLTGDFKADQAVTLATGFNSLVSGVAAGVLARNGEIYFTCIPDLWKITSDAFRDQNVIPDFAFPVKPYVPNKDFKMTKLHGGFGVHIAFGGHDMHGLKFGPDGKLYWTIADRGFTPPENIKGAGFSNAFLRRVLPDSGAVFRCNPDGSNLEVVCVGLRNPQEIAFDQFGNLFTVDNNADGGDKARVHYLVEGADYGWRYGWQHLPKLGAWNDEMLWGLSGSNSSLYQLHPIAHVTHGPSGLAYYPGTGLSARFNDHFFVADFPGGIRYFKAEPFGAGFTVFNADEYLMNNKPENMAGKLLWNLYPTDVDFAPDGGIYVLDWVYGWEKTGKGRIYRLHDPSLVTDMQVAETKVLLAGGMTKRGNSDLVGLLSHVDQRVRLAAQEELAVRGRSTESIGPADGLEAALIQRALTIGDTRARVHALWALIPMHQGRVERFRPLLMALKDPDPEVRAQVARAIGVLQFAAAAPELTAALLAENSPRVKYFAMASLGQLGNPAVIPTLADQLRANDDRDPLIRHAAVMALVTLGDKEAIVQMANDSATAVRLASLLAMRRLEMPEITAFVRDAAPHLALEAARAINDAPIEAGFSELASALNTPGRTNAFLLRRAINANFRLGRIEHVQNLLAFAENQEAPAALRAEAVESIGDWAKPSGRDRVVGLWRPLPEREARAATLPLRLAAEPLLTKAPDAVRIAAAQTLAKLGLTESAGQLLDLVKNPELNALVRIAALKALADLKVPQLTEAIAIAKADKAEALRKESSRLLGTGDAASAVESLKETLQRGSISEQQTVYDTLGGIKGKEADTVIRSALDQLLAGKLRPELALDVVEAASKRSSPSIKEKLAAYQATWKKDDTLAGYRELLVGGDSADGRTIFYERAEAGCFRCHKVSGDGGDVGPELAGLVAQKGRDYVLESILYPNKHIATGYETLNVVMKAGQNYAGIKKAEDEASLTLNSPEDGELKLAKKEIERSSTGMSAMPEGLGGMLNKREMRDLLEFLATAPAPAKR